jgi:MFS transporter, DHA1 family, multidrug resistance protein
MKIIGKVPLWMLICLFGLSHGTEVACTSALPDISHSFNVSGSIAQLSSSTYFLGFALGILLLGRVSDIFGRRPVMLWGMAFYLFSSVISIFAVNIEMLIAARFCQAFGASVGSVVGQAMSRDSYAGRALSYVYASVSLGVAFIPSIGSAIGGYIVEYSGWRYVFVFLSIISSILLLIYSKLLPETNAYTNNVRNNKYFTVFKVVITDKIVLLYALIVGAFNGIAFGFYIEAPFIFINKIGMHPSSYGKLIFLLAIASAFGSFMSRYLVNKHIHIPKMITFGLILSLIGCAILVIFSTLFTTNINKVFATIVIFTPMMLHMIGHSLVVPMVLRYALEDYTKVTGTAGSVFGTLYYLLVACISFTVSKLHSDTIVKFSLLFLALSSLCCLSFYLIQKWHPIKRKYEFI